MEDNVIVADDFRFEPGADPGTINLNLLDAGGRVVAALALDVPDELAWLAERCVRIDRRFDILEAGASGPMDITPPYDKKRLH